MHAQDALVYAYYPTCTPLVTPLLLLHSHHLQLIIGPIMISLDDITDYDSDTLFPMKIIRQYSSYIHKRRTVGPVGKGWIVPIL